MLKNGSTVFFNYIEVGEVNVVDHKLLSNAGKNSHCSYIQVTLSSTLHLKSYYT